MQDIRGQEKTDETQWYRTEIPPSDASIASEKYVGEKSMGEDSVVNSIWVKSLWLKSLWMKLSVF